MIVLLVYIDLSAEMQPLTVLDSLLHQQHLATLTYCLANPELSACNITRKNFMRIIGIDKRIK